MYVCTCMHIYHINVFGISHSLLYLFRTQCEHFGSLRITSTSSGDVATGRSQCQKKCNILETYANTHGYVCMCTQMAHKKEERKQIRIEMEFSIEK